MPQKNALSDGFTMRYLKEDDLDALKELFDAFTRAVYGTEEADMTGMVRVLQMPEFDAESSTRLIFAPDGTLVGYGSIWDVDDPPVQVQFGARIHPDYEGRGLGTVLMQWGEQRAHEAIARCPEGVRVCYHTNSVMGYEPTEALFRKFGLKPIRHFWTMMIDRQEKPPQPVIPEGITIRPAHYPDEFEAIVRADNEAFRDHWGHVEHPIEMVLERWREFMVNRPGFDPALWFVAVDDASGEIAGINICRDQMRNNPAYGYVSSLAVRRPWRKRGLGLALLQLSFNEFWKRGKEKVGLGVDASSLTGATRLYEKAGMEVERQGTAWEKVLREGTDLSTTEVE